MGKPCPWVVSFERLHWPSHQSTVPALRRMFESFPCSIPSMPLRSLKELDQNASCLILIHPLESALSFLRTLRMRHGVRLPVVVLEATNVAVGGLIYSEYRCVLDDNDAIVCLSEAEQALVRQALPMNQVFRIPYPLADEDFKAPSLGETTRLREQLGLKSKEQMIISVGRLTPQRNIEALITAFKRAYSRDSSLRLFFVGDFRSEMDPCMGIVGAEEYKRRVMALIRALGLEKVIRITGHLARPKVLRYLSACDLHIVLSTYHREEFGYAVAEGMARRAPTLVTRWGGGHDFVSGGGAAGVELPLDARSVAELILEMLEPSVNVRWRARGYSFARRHLHEKKVAQLWQEALKKLRPPASKGLTLASHVQDFYLETLMREKEIRANPHAPFFPSTRHPYYQWVRKHYATGSRQAFNPQGGA